MIGHKASGEVMARLRSRQGHRHFKKAGIVRFTGLARKLFFVPLLRCVDDFFGSSLIGFGLRGGAVYQLLLNFCGVPCDLKEKR